MARGASGRIVIEAGSDLKKRLYSVLAAQGLTLKDWFVQAAETQIRQHQQPSLFPEETTSSSTHKLGTPP